MRSTRRIARRSPIVQPPPPRAPDPETVTVTIATETLRALVGDMRDAAIVLRDEGRGHPLITAEAALLRAFGLEPAP